MIDINKDELIKVLPQFNLLTDNGLKEEIINIWIETCKKADWNNLLDIPFGPGSDPVKFGFIHHVALVTQYTYDVAIEYNKMEEKKLNVDYAVAGALLHDVCKIVEYSANGGRTKWGNMVTHAIYGVGICESHKIPIEIIHIVASHTAKLSMSNKSPEAIIVSKCDSIAAGCVHLFEEKKD